MGQKKSFWNPLETRTYKFKKAAIEFFCPLCRTQRAISTHHKLTLMNYGQISLLTFLVSVALWPWAGIRGALSFFPILMVFEAVRRMLFSKDIPCPHCGFDASWYKRDVKVARKLVEDFWTEKGIEDGAVSNIEPLSLQSPLEDNDTMSQSYFS